MTRLLALFLIISSFSAAATPAAPFIGSCQYYSVLSSYMKCSNNGYLMQFGHRYCQIFVGEEPTFTVKGRQVLDNIRTCLQVSLEQATNLTCANVETVAAASHVDCYEKSGFCGLTFWEQTLLAVSISPSLFDPHIQTAVEMVEERCLQDGLAELNTAGS